MIHLKGTSLHSYLVFYVKIRRTISAKLKPLITYKKFLYKQQKYVYVGNVWGQISRVGSDFQTLVLYIF